MSEIEFDHIAIAVPRMADAPVVLVGALGGTPTGAGGPSGAYTWAQWGFAGGGRLEVLEPLGEDGFLHPKEALGVVVQLAESRDAESAPEAAWPAPPGPPDPPPAVTIVGLRTRARSAERADTQWGRVLLGHRGLAGGALVYRWPRSPMRIAVEVDPGAEEGPMAVEFASARTVGLPRTPHPVLGAVFHRGSA